MNRTPPIEIRRQLRREVQFGCPVPNCGNPYLEWHHFDPPWRVKEHHNPDGMIAICCQHHPQADAGAFTVEQLRQFKVDASASSRTVGGRFEWLRRKLLAVVGGNYYLGRDEILRYKGNPVIWFTRDEGGNFMLNFGPLSRSDAPRLAMEENFWLAHGDLADLDCPPSGKLIHARYPNGDEFKVEFFECDDAHSLRRRYPDANEAG
jgi:hypothetical protein